MNNTENNTTKRFLTWGSFVLIIGLVIWGLIAAEKKANREGAGLLLPDQIAVTDHIRGADTASVTLVEYGDFQCPACAYSYPLIEQLINSNSSTTLRFVPRHFPLAQHSNAISAAQSAEAAGKQGKFWEMYGMLYERQKAWETSTDGKNSAKNIFIGYARELGLDEEKFLADFELQEIKDKIINDQKGGIKAGVNSTPTFFVNGKKINNPQSYDEFKKAVGL